MQAERRKLEADNVTADRAAWTEHCAIGLMVDALGRWGGRGRWPSRLRQAARSEPARDKRNRCQRPVAAAEEYALIYPRRAALIRSLGRVPDNPSFGPPEEFLVRALVNGRTPVLMALDRQGTEVGAV